MLYCVTQHSSYLNYVKIFLLTPAVLQLFLVLGNERVNSFWAANVPPSEALTLSSCSEDRRRFITNKYRQGKYRKYHPLYGNQNELNNVSRSI